MDNYHGLAARSKIDSVAKELKKFYEVQKDVSYPIAEVREHLQFMVYTYGESVLENNGEVLMMPNRAEYQALREMLGGRRRRALADQPERSTQNELFVESENKYNGFAKFSPARLQAMVIHLAHRGKKVFPTRLNKLLFYADFSYFALRGRSISGAEYTKLTHGPIFSGYQNLVNELERKRQIRVTRIKSKGKFAQAFRSKKTYSPSKSVLSSEELRFLDWVIATYDGLSTTELIAISHREMAYWNTHWKQPIDYHLAEHLEKKPPTELLDGSKSTVRTRKRERRRKLHR